MSDKSWHEKKMAELSDSMARAERIEHPRAAIMSEANDKWFIKELRIVHTFVGDVYDCVLRKNGVGDDVERTGKGDWLEASAEAKRILDRRNAEGEKAEVQPPAGFVFTDAPTINDGRGKALRHFLQWNPLYAFGSYDALQSGYRWLAFAPSKREEGLQNLLDVANDKVKALKDQRIQLLGQIETLKAERNEEERQHMLTDDKVKALEADRDSWRGVSERLVKELEVKVETWRTVARVNDKEADRLRGKAEALEEDKATLNKVIDGLETERIELKRSLGKANMENVSLRNVIDLVKRNKQPAPSNGVEWEEDVEGLFWWRSDGASWLMVRDDKGDVWRGAAGLQVETVGLTRVRPKGWVRS